MRRARRSRQTPLWGGFVAAAAMTPLPHRKGTPRSGAGSLHAGAREGILTHLTAELHVMLAHAIVAGIALTCIGVLIYFGFRHYSVRRYGPQPKTANVRVRPGMSAWEVRQKEANRR